MLSSEKIDCPYCGERIEIVIDESMGEEQQYIEDCFVCCRPIVLDIYCDPDSESYSVYAKTENE